MEVLTCNNITKKVGKKIIIDDISLSLKTGEVIGLIGPNGAGKTSLMKLLVGLYYIDEGCISSLDNDQKLDFPNYIKNIGAIIENPMFYPKLTGKQCLNYYSIIRDINNNRIKEVSDLTGINSILNQQVKTYSLGNKQRLGIAQALLVDPQLLILDEPFNGLDPDGILELRNIILKQKEKNKTILISSHTLPELEQICDRFIFLKTGKIIEELENKDFENTNFSIIDIDPKDFTNVEKLLESQCTYPFEIDDTRIIFKGVEQEYILDLIFWLKNKNVNVINFENKKETLQDYYEKIILGGKK
ncbi:ABC transporter ATP-binding protein [Vagococcus hydrophili]|uniref:ABC transporter ATP-binding protein n=1 Tax=Vagococcus hydrophili TaxID=2714947 RepID=A0A6G8AUT0_9ENTE|nr:ABC transporter ATP-binding protein [Vagococcus hydrophili]QIL48740.1 ABC transporter ATP-binding protein [Vagococcus hydrophili]